MSSTSSTALRSRLTARAILDADAVVGRRRRARPVDLHPQHHAARFTPELNVEDVQPVVGGNPRCHLSHPFDDVAGHIAPRGALKRKKWAHAHFGPPPRLRTQNYSIATLALNWPRNQVVVARPDDFDLGKIPRAQAGRVAVGQIDRGVDIRRLRRQPPLQDQVVVAGGSIDQNPARSRRFSRVGGGRPAASAAPSPARRRACFSGAGTSSSSAKADVPSSCE